MAIATKSITSIIHVAEAVRAAEVNGCKVLIKRNDQDIWDEAYIDRDGELTTALYIDPPTQDELLQDYDIIDEATMEYTEKVCYINIQGA